MRFSYRIHHKLLNVTVRCDMLICVSDEAHRRPYVLKVLHDRFLTSIITDVEVSELMKAAGVTYP
jgi:hypothetical protein